MKQLQLLVMLCLACREPPQDVPRLLVETFEQSCEGVPCGWEQLDGSEGQVQWVHTIHPGEHGLRLQAGASARGPGGPSQSIFIMSGSIQVAASARCDEGAELLVDAVIGESTSTVTDVFSGRSAPPPEWNSTYEIITLTAQRALLDGGIGGNPLGGGTSLNIELLGLTLRVEGEGACEVDHLIVDGVGTLSTGLRPQGC